MLVSAGANVDAADRDGYTSLHLSTCVEVSQVLVAARADVNATDNLVGASIDRGIEAG